MSKMGRVRPCAPLGRCLQPAALLGRDACLKTVVHANLFVEADETLPVCAQGHAEFQRDRLILEPGSQQR